MVISSLGDDVVLLRASHSEVKRLVLLVFVVVGVVLVAVNVFGGHVMVAGILIVVGRVSVFRVDCMSLGVVSSVCSLLVDNWSFVLAKSFEMGFLVVDRGSGMGFLMVDWGSSMMHSLMVDWSSSVMDSLMVDWSSNVVNSLMVDWSSNVVNSLGLMVHWGSMMNWSFVMDRGSVRSLMNWFGSVMHWSSSLVGWSRVLAKSFKVRSFLMHRLEHDLGMLGGSVVNWDSVVDWNSVVNWGSVVGLLEDWGGVVDFSDSLVVSSGAVMGTSHVMRFIMGDNVCLSLVLHMNWVLHVVHGGVVGLHDVGGANVFSVVRLRGLVCWLVVSHNGN